MSPEERSNQIHLQFQMATHLAQQTILHVNGHVPLGGKASAVHGQVGGNRGRVAVGGNSIRPTRSRACSETLSPARSTAHTAVIQATSASYLRPDGCRFLGVNNEIPCHSLTLSVSCSGQRGRVPVCRAPRVSPSGRDFKQKRYLMCECVYSAALVVGGSSGFQG